MPGASNDTSIYDGPAGVENWVKRCGFLTYMDAAKALGVDWRTLWRYRKNGLPGKKADTEAWRGNLVRKMARIEKQRRR